MRGLAILLVVAYHTGIGVGAGYLGVDIFFVVSGYLITRMVSRELDAGTFRFRDFYTRRAKRLLPAAYVTLALTTLAAIWLLTSREFIDFGKTLEGAVTFTGNIALLGQTGYFDGSPETKPLLHTWSLAIEEQYYLALPLLLWLLPKRARVPGMGVLMIASIGLCFLLRGSQPNDVFYRVEFRAWELGIGSLAAFAPEGGRAVRRLFWPALAVVIVLPCLPMFRPHPGAHALVLDLATAVVLVRNHSCFATRSSQRWLRPLAWLGDVSYSWYLLHWPPIAFLHAVYLGNPPGLVKVVSALGTLLAAALMYRFVEQPARHHPFRFTLPRFAAAFAVSGLLFAAPYAWSTSAHLEQRALARADNVGFDERCDFDGIYSSLPECENAKNPKVLVWGDSLGMHLVSALAKVSPDGIRQATKTSCGPLLGRAPVNDKRLTQAWATDCLRFNQDVLTQLEQSPSIGTVVLASSFQRYANPSFGEVLMTTDHGDVVTKPSVELAEDGLRKTVTAITRLGKRVVIVAPPPSATFDVGACLERRFYGKPTLGPHASCQIADLERLDDQRNVLALMAEVARWPGVKLVDLAGPLCEAGVCRTVQGGVPLYIDEQHLTVEGSTLLANAHDWGGWTRRDASPSGTSQQEAGR
ncbi:acyltransferase family protein [Trinickia fusca]|uniref:acyltransferase family protein n=1 Tax=Trinickia fusca TaxID=2419777 RepID=UPI001C7D8AC8|nr:acyltransferase family protein [Trinickia fusca]